VLDTLLNIFIMNSWYYAVLLLSKSEHNEIPTEYSTILPDTEISVIRARIT